MITKKKLIIIWFIGLISGFTLMISGNTLNFWLAKEKIDITTIGIFALISVPYAVNFIWAPIIDTKNIPVLTKIFGRHSAWVIVIQLLMSLSIYLLSILNPSENLLLFAIVALIISFLSSTQDTVLGAYRVEIVDDSKQGEVSGIYIFGYRIGMLISSSLAIYISTYLKWYLIYKFFSLIILCFLAIFLILSKEKSALIFTQSKIKLPISNPNEKLSFGSLKYPIILLAFLILYRLPDNFINMMINPFLLHIGYDEFDISILGKFFGILAAIIGGLVASIMMRYYDIFKSLLLFGAFHAFAHTLFIIQEIYGKNINLLIFVTGFESITGGMTMAAYMGYIASLCQGKFKATKYSFLTSMMGLSRSILPVFSGYIVTVIGWKLFYLFAAFATIPSLILILFLKKMYSQDAFVQYKLDTE